MANKKSEKKERMHILGLSVKNVKCLKEVALDEMGDLVEIRGDSGQGKTSILDSIEAAFNGLDPAMIRRHEQKAEIELHLTDMVIKRIRDAENDTLMVQHHGAPVEKAAQFLRTICGPSAFRPLNWVRMAEGPSNGKTKRLREQRAQLLEALSMELDEKTVLHGIKRNLGEDYLEDLGALNLGDIEFDQHPFVVCGEFERVCGKKRYDLGKEADQKNSILKTMEAPKNPAPVADLAECQRIEQEAVAAYHQAKGAAGNREHLEGRIARLESQILDEEPNLPELKDLDHTEKAYQVEAKSLNDKIKSLRDQLKAAENEALDVSLKLKQCRQYRERIADQEARKADLKRLQEEIANESDVDLEGLRRAMENAQLDRELREQQDRYDAAANGYEVAKARAKRYQELVGFFRDTMPKLLLEQADLPVEGLGVDDDQVTIQGIPLHQLGTSEQIRVGVQIAAALNPRSGFVLIDGAESLGRQDRITLAEEAKRLDLQLIMTYVDPDAAADSDAVVMFDGLRLAS